MSNNYEKKCAFISNVYSTLVKQLLLMVTMVAISRTTFGYTYINPIITSAPLLWIFSTFVSQQIIQSYYYTASTEHINLLLGAFTVFISNILICGTVYVSSTVMLISLIMTALLVFVLNYHASKTSYDYSVWYNYVSSLFAVTIVISFVCMFANIDCNLIIWSVLSGVLISLFIIIDTQLLINNDSLIDVHNGHVLIAMSLFVDIVNMFLRVVTIVNKLLNNDKKKRA